jgi:hypothetical protein
MPIQKLPLPIKGLNRGLTVAIVPAEYSTNMNNVRPRDVLESKIRLGQRPGLAKWSATQVGDADNPIVAIASVSSIS